MDISKLFPVKTLMQGDDWLFNVYLTDYDSTLYTLKYIFKKANTAAFTITATSALDGSFQFVATDTQTASFQPGLYYVSAVILDAGLLKTTLGQSEIQIKPDISTVDDPRTPERIALDEIEAYLRAGAGSDVESYTINGTSYKLNHSMLMEKRAYFMALVRKQEKISAVNYIQYYL